MKKNILDSLLKTFDAQIDANALRNIQEDNNNFNDVYNYLVDGVITGDESNTMRRLTQEDANMLFDVFINNMGTPQESAEVMSFEDDGMQAYNFNVTDSGKYKNMPNPIRKKNIFGKKGFSFLPPVQPEIANILNKLQNFERIDGESTQSMFDRMYMQGILPSNPNLNKQ